MTYKLWVSSRRSSKRLVRFDADRADRQFGIGQRLAGEQAALSAASQLGGMGQQFANMGAGLASLGERQRAADIQGAQLLDTLGRDIRAEDPARLDLSYEDFVRQREFPAQQYERIWTSRGMPVTPNVDIQRMQAYNPLSSALGAGISALGLYRTDRMNIIDLQESLKDYLTMD